MKQFKEFINENITSNVNTAIKCINNEINEDPDSIDVIIFDLLDGISDKGQDDLVINQIEGWLEQLKNK